MLEIENERPRPTPNEIAEWVTARLDEGYVPLRAPTRDDKSGKRGSPVPTHQLSVAAILGGPVMVRKG